MRMVLMLIKFDDMPWNFRRFQYIFAIKLSAKFFRTSKFWDMVNGNLTIRVFKKLECSNQYAPRFNASMSRKAEGMLLILIRSEQMNKI